MIERLKTNEDIGGSGLTHGEIHVLVVIERVGAGLSMVAIAIIISSYILFEKLRTTPNLFLFCAAIANAGASVASMIGYDGLILGKNSSLCQAQSFIFQWFMQADPWWSFAMAVNVYLVFFHNVRPAVFRQWVWAYCVVCYGGPLITALTLVSIRNDPRGLVYGDAVLWCWIDSKWSLVRIYSYYIPVWLCILLSILIYAAVGYHVFHHRNQLRNMDLDSADKEPGCGTGTSSDARDSAEECLNRQPEFYGTAVTEVQVTSDPPFPTSKASVVLPPVIYSPTAIGRGRPCIAECDKYNKGFAPRSGSQHFETICSSDWQPHQRRTVMARLRGVRSSATFKLKRLDPVKVSYLRTSFIFGFAVLITWIPSSINRLYTLGHDGRVSFGLSVASGCVLPLQGVWNALIYFTTSWTTFQDELKTFGEKPRGKSSHHRRGMARAGSQLGAAAINRRNTFERLRYPQVDFLDSSHQSQNDIELDE